MKDQTNRRVGQDCHVEVELIDEENNSERLEFDLVSEAAADFDNGRLGVHAPLGKAIRGKPVGSVVDYAMGDIRKVRIIHVQPVQSKPDEDAAERRQAILDEALRKVESTNVDMFASSYSGKWGDYNSGDAGDVTTDEVDNEMDNSG